MAQEQNFPIVPIEEARGQVTPARIVLSTQAVHNLFFLVRLYEPYTLEELKGRLMVQTAGSTLYLFRVGKATWNRREEREVRIETEGPVYIYPAISQQVAEQLLALNQPEEETTT